MNLFISYAREDMPTVMAMQSALEIHQVWFDQRLSVGQQWWSEIERQIAASHCLLFLLSASSLESEYCQKELDYALRLGKPVAPVMVHPVVLPDTLKPYQVIEIGTEFTPAAIARLLNGLFEIERHVFNPLRVNAVNRQGQAELAIGDLYFASANPRKKQMFEQILNAPLQTAAIALDDIQHVDPGEIALHKARQAYAILGKPVFVEHSALAVRAWGGLPGGLTTTFLLPAGLSTICKMLHPFQDKYAEAISAIGFSDGQMVRKFVGVVPGEIPTEPRGNGYSWNNIFVPAGFTRTLGEMTEDEMLSLSSRRRAMIEFMRFLQYTYAVV